MSKLIRVKPNDKDWINYTPKHSVFIDIGVGVVNSEAWLIKDKWPKTKIIGLEPHSGRLDKCKESFPGKILRYAIWHEDAELEMQNIDGMAVCFPRTHQVGPSKTKVKGRSLDSLNDQFGPWENIFIWSDTEGSELEMLKGATKLLEQKKIVGLNLEVWRYWQADGWCIYDEVVEFLAAYGFEPRYLTQDPDTWKFADCIFLPHSNL